MLDPLHATDQHNNKILIIKKFSRLTLNFLDVACYVSTEYLFADYQIINQNINLATSNSYFESRNSYLVTRNSKLKTQNSKLETQNSKLALLPLNSLFYREFPILNHFSLLFLLTSRLSIPLLCTIFHQNDVSKGLLKNDRPEFSTFFPKQKHIRKLSSDAD